ncbi:hypothetical protein DF185_10570 [Marinifilum breve]|uniref:Thioredoxin domain-containing protein n=1 Tax=Marinifilum breve TaxID=2184082 RepID=A0A2V3ZZV4_9BACT|nr:TlpA disulfide reductase family protein [Marinifilum breve]PXY01087.1 hypothetical protein DF185_10570 [Marinifilum breve]
MKQILLIAFVALLMSCQHQRDTYLITGNLTNIPDSSIINLYIDYGDMGKRIATDTVINGYFEFSDSLVKQPSKMNLRMKDWQNFYGQCDLWVEHEKITVNGDGKYLATWQVVSNIKEQIVLNKFVEATRTMDATIDSLSIARMKSINNREIASEMMHEIDSLYKRKQNIEYDLIKENPNSRTALNKLYYKIKFDKSTPKEEVREIYNRIDEEYKNTLHAQGILTCLEDRKAPEIGDKMIDFVAHDTDGKNHSLSEYKGKYLLLDFWSMGCGPCMMAMPETKKLDSLNRDQLCIIGLNMASSEETWKDVSIKKNISWVNLSDGKSTFSGISSVYGITAFPTYILIDPDGKIIDKWMGYSKGHLEEKLKKHIENLKV